MEKLGIRPANQHEYRWRWQLFIRNPPLSRKKKIVLLLNPYLVKMNLRKPYMLVWYIMAQGDRMMERLETMEKVEVEGLLWQMVGELSGEFHVNRPIQ